MDYRRYIYPLDSDTDGSGVLVGNLFVTAGHVIDTSNKPAVVIEGESYNLVKEKAIIIDTNPDKRSDGYDVAVFQLNGIYSPLKFADESPNEGKELLSCSYKHTTSGITGLASNIFSSSIKEDWLYEQRIGKVVSHYDNYFECHFAEPLSRGSSGSPIFDGDRMAGIVYGDKEGKDSSNSVLFLSASVIVELLKCKGYGQH